MKGITRRKLLQIDAATWLETLRVPPGNRLEALSADRVGHHSVRINDRWRIPLADLLRVARGRRL